MKTSAELRALEASAIASGIAEKDLMELAGRQVARSLQRHFGSGRAIIICVGKGHNGGDALVTARYLHRAGWSVSLLSPYPTEQWAPLTRSNYDRLGSPPLETSLHAIDCGNNAQPILILDGLLGIGARAGLTDDLLPLAHEIEQYRQSGAHIVALDLPSGLQADSGETGEGAVRADLTLTIGTLKPGLLVDGAEHFVGRLDVVDFSLFADFEPQDSLTTANYLNAVLPRRPYGMHKGQAGRVAIVAGSRGYLGAARLTAEAALRGGAGLVTLFVTEELYPLLATSVRAEIMVQPVGDYSEIPCEQFDVLAIGPGLGPSPPGFYQLLEKATGPLVLDADGLNLIASEPARWLRRGMILTPHPGEMARLYPSVGKLSRAEVARAFVELHEVILLFKGARTIVTAPGEPLYYNGTGGPGMASGGQGDVLTGLIAALVAQGASPLAAARAGAWLAGRTADELVLKRSRSEETLLAGDIIAELTLGYRAFIERL